MAYVDGFVTPVPKKKLAAYKRVTQLLIADSPLPKTAIQKVSRAHLSEEYEFSVKRWREQAGATAE